MQYFCFACFQARFVSYFIQASESEWIEASDSEDEDEDDSENGDCDSEDDSDNSGDEDEDLDLEVLLLSIEFSKTMKKMLFFLLCFHRDQNQLFVCEGHKWSCYITSNGGCCCYNKGRRKKSSKEGEKGQD